MAKKIDYASLYTLRSDGRYCGTYSDETGRHFVYDRDPEKLYQKIQAKMHPAEKVLTFRDVAEEWAGEHREEIETRTWNNYAPHYADILAHHGDTPFHDVTAMDVTADLKRAKSRGYSATVVRTRRAIYNMIFDYAVIHGYTKYNPISSVKLPKGLKHGKRTAPTGEQMRIICTSVDAPFGLFPFFLLCTGLRKSEALALGWEDVDFQKKEIYITKSLDYTNGANPKYKPPKTEAGVRVVPILDVLMPHLEAAYQTSDNDLLFPCPRSNRGGEGGGLMTDRCYDGLWKRYCSAVGLVENGKPVITAHNLRHGTATLMFELGVDELTAQKILGHSRIEITREIYTDLRTAQQSKSVAKLNAGLSKMLSE